MNEAAESPSRRLVELESTLDGGLFKARRGINDRRQRQPPAREPQELATAIDAALARARDELADILAAHGVSHLSVSVDGDGDRSYRWEWSAQLSLVLDGRLR